MKYCVRCVLPETKPDLTFNEKGVCDACQSTELKKRIDWKSRKKEFEKLIEKYRNKSGDNYDCIIPVSGGKDSYYQAYVCKVLYGLNPLLISFEPTPFSRLGEKNLSNMTRVFGCDLIHFRKNPVVYVKLARIAFERVGDHAWPNHVGINTTPVRIAVKFHVPLIVWGENTQLEYGGPEKDRLTTVFDRRYFEEYCGLLGNRIEDMVGVNGLTKQDLLPYTYPSETELSDNRVTGIFLGSFFRWNEAVQTNLMIKKCGFTIKKEPSLVKAHLHLKSLDDESVVTHDYLKFVKYGFDRVNDQTSIAIRNNTMTREEGVRIVRKYSGKMDPKMLRVFLQHYGYTKSAFYRIADSFTNKSLFETDRKGNLGRDAHGDLIRKFLP